MNPNIEAIAAALRNAWAAEFGIGLAEDLSNRLAAKIAQHGIVAVDALTDEQAHGTYHNPPACTAPEHGAQLKTALRNIAYDSAQEVL